MPYENITIQAMNYGQAWDAVIALVRARRGEDFTTADLTRFLAISRQSAHAWLRRFVNDKRLVAVGQGRATRYRIAPYEPARPVINRPAPQITTAGSTATISVWGGGVPTMSDSGNVSPELFSEQQEKRKK